MEGKVRIAGPRLRQEAGGKVIALRRKSVGGKPRDITSAPAADVGGRARPKEPPHDGVEVGGRRLLVPVLRESGGAGVVGAERRIIHCEADPPIACRASGSPARRSGWSRSWRDRSSPWRPPARTARTPRAPPRRPSDPCGRWSNTSG